MMEVSVQILMTNMKTHLARNKKGGVPAEAEKVVGGQEGVEEQVKNFVQPFVLPLPWVF